MNGRTPQVGFIDTSIMTGLIEIDAGNAWLETQVTEEQVIPIFKEQEAGERPVDICGRYGVSQPMFWFLGDPRLLEYKGLKLNLKRPRRIYSEEKKQAAQRRLGAWARYWKLMEFLAEVNIC